MRINQNIAALNAWRNLTATDVQMNKSLERLSSGLRINRAADDAAGLAISEKMRSQSRGLTQAVRNASDGISMLQTAEGALQEATSVLQRMRELSIQAASGTLTNADRAELQKEVSNLKEELDRIALTTEFNTRKLLDGSLGQAQVAQGAELQSIKLMRGAQAEVKAKTNAAFTDLSTVEYGRSFNISIDGGEAKTITLTKKNYTTVDLYVDEIQARIDADPDLKGKVTVSKDGAGTKVLFTRVAAGAGKSVTVSGGGTQFRTGVVESTVLPASVTAGGNATMVDYSATPKSFSISVGGVSKTINLTENVSAYTDTQYVTYLQNKIDAAFAGSNVGTYPYRSGDIQVTDTDAGAGATIKIELKAALANATGVDNQFSIANVTGTPLTDMSIAAGSYEGTDDEFQVILGGGTAYNVRVDVGSYGNAGALAEAVQRAIDREAGLLGKLKVEPDSGGTRLVFTTIGAAAHQKIDFNSVDANAYTGATGFQLDAADNLGAAASEARNILDYLGLADAGNLTGTIDGADQTISSSQIGLKDTGANGTTALVATDKLALATADSGETLDLNGGSQIVIRGMVGGVEASYTFTMTSTTTVQNLLDQIKSTLGAAAVEVTTDGNLKVTGVSGRANNITEFGLSVSGNNAFNNKLGSWEQLQEAQDARADQTVNLHVGANAGQTINLAVDDMSAIALGVNGINVSTAQSASFAVNAIDKALTKISGERSNLGALQNRLEHTIKNLSTAAENLTAAESRIRDADMAMEMSIFTRNQILIQAGTAMMAQANQKTQSVLDLLR